MHLFSKKDAFRINYVPLPDPGCAGCEGTCTAKCANSCSGSCQGWCKGSCGTTLYGGPQ